MDILIGTENNFETSIMNLYNVVSFIFCYSSTLIYFLFIDNCLPEFFCLYLFQLFDYLFIHFCIYLFTHLHVLYKNAFLYIVKMSHGKILLSILSLKIRIHQTLHVIKLLKTARKASLVKSETNSI